MQELGEISRKQFSVAYNGANRQTNHTIDVELLAPALIAMGKLIREVNKEINGKYTKANVMVVSDFEHKCFNINFEITITLLEQLGTLIENPRVKDAKQILQFLGILSAVGVDGLDASFGLLQYLRWRKGRKIEEVEELHDKGQNGQVSVKVFGDNNNIIINNKVLKLSNNPRALAATRDVLSPIGNGGFDKIELREGEKKIGEIPIEHVDEILASCTLGIDEAKDTIPDIEITSAWLTVYSPVYEKSADKWRFRHGKETIYADISETTIALDALQRGGAMADDTYQVRLEITTPKSPDGKSLKEKYKILEVLRFIQASPEIQSNLNLEK